MFEIRKYKFGFDIWGLLLFVAIMLPNFIWFAVPAQNDILRNESTTVVIDTIASVFQVMMIIALVVVFNNSCNKPMNKGIRIGIIAMIILYYSGWILYYLGMTNIVIIMDLSVAPCIAFVLFSIGRKNVFALVSATIFMICHLTYGIVNFG